MSKDSRTALSPENSSLRDGALRLYDGALRAYIKGRPGYNVDLHKQKETKAFKAEINFPYLLKSAIEHHQTLDKSQQVSEKTLQELKQLDWKKFTKKLGEKDSARSPLSQIEKLFIEELEFLVRAKHVKFTASAAINSVTEKHVEDKDLRQNVFVGIQNKNISGNTDYLTMKTVIDSVVTDYYTNIQLSANKSPELQSAQGDILSSKPSLLVKTPSPKKANPKKETINRDYLVTILENRKELIKSTSTALTVNNDTTIVAQIDQVINIVANAPQADINKASLLSSIEGLKASSTSHEGTLGGIIDDINKAPDITQKSLEKTQKLTAKLAVYASATGAEKPGELDEKADALYKELKQDNPKFIKYVFSVQSIDPKTANDIPHPNPVLFSTDEAVQAKCKSIAENSLKGFEYNIDEEIGKIKKVIKQEQKEQTSSRKTSSDSKSSATPLSSASAAAVSDTGSRPATPPSTESSTSIEKRLAQSAALLHSATQPDDLASLKNQKDKLKQAFLNKIIPNSVTRQVFFDSDTLQGITTSAVKKKEAASNHIKKMFEKEDTEVIAFIDKLSSNSPFNETEVKTPFKTPGGAMIELDININLHLEAFRTELNNHPEAVAALTEYRGAVANYVSALSRDSKGKEPATSQTPPATPVAKQQNNTLNAGSTPIPLPIPAAPAQTVTTEFNTKDAGRTPKIQPTSPLSSDVLIAEAAARKAAEDEARKAEAAKKAADEAAKKAADEAARIEEERQAAEKEHNKFVAATKLNNAYQTFAERTKELFVALDEDTKQQLNKKLDKLKVSPETQNNVIQDTYNTLTSSDRVFEVLVTDKTTRQEILAGIENPTVLNHTLNFVANDYLSALREYAATKGLSLKEHTYNGTDEVAPQQARGDKTVRLNPDPRFPDKAPPLPDALKSKPFIPAKSDEKKSNRLSRFFIRDSGNKQDTTKTPEISPPTGFTRKPQQDIESQPGLAPTAPSRHTVSFGNKPAEAVHEKDTTASLEEQASAVFGPAQGTELSGFRTNSSIHLGINNPRNLTDKPTDTMRDATQQAKKLAAAAALEKGKGRDVDPVDSNPIATGILPPSHQNAPALTGSTAQQQADYLKNALTNIVQLSVVNQAIGSHTDSLRPKAKRGLFGFGKKPAAAAPAPSIQDEIKKTLTENKITEIVNGLPFGDDAKNMSEGDKQLIKSGVKETLIGIKNSPDNFKADEIEKIAEQALKKNKDVNQLAMDQKAVLYLLDPNDKENELKGGDPASYISRVTGDKPITKERAKQMLGFLEAGYQFMLRSDNPDVTKTRIEKLKTALNDAVNNDTGIVDLNNILESGKKTHEQKQKALIEATKIRINLQTYVSNDRALQELLTGQFAPIFVVALASELKQEEKNKGGTTPFVTRDGTGSIHKSVKYDDAYKADETITSSRDVLKSFVKSDEIKKAFINSTEATKTAEPLSHDMLCGIGVHIVKTEFGWVVASEVDKNSPAGRANMQQGDILKNITENGKTTDLSAINDTKEVAALLRGKIGTEVTIGITGVREGQHAEGNLKITRSIVKWNKESQKMEAVDPASLLNKPVGRDAAGPAFC